MGWVNPSWAPRLYSFWFYKKKNNLSGVRRCPELDVCMLDRYIWLQHKLLKLTESPNMWHWKSVKKSKVSVVFGAKYGPDYIQMWWKNKETRIQMVFLNILHSYTFTRRSSGYRNICEWKLNAILARNTIFVWRKPGRNFCPLWVKNSETWLF